MNAAEKHIMSGVGALKHPRFAMMSQQDRLLRVVVMAYLKHSGLPLSDEIGWDELTNALHDEICNTIGDKAYCAWSERMKTDFEVED